MMLPAEKFLRSGDFLAMCDDVVNMEGQMILFRHVFREKSFPPGKAVTWSLSACPFTIYLLDPIGYSTGQAASFWITQWKFGSDLTSGIHMKPD